MLALLGGWRKKMKLMKPTRLLGTPTCSSSIQHLLSQYHRSSLSSTRTLKLRSYSTPSDRSSSIEPIHRPPQTELGRSVNKTTSNNDQDINLQERNQQIKPPPYLPRPLGVQDPPSTKPLTEQERLAKLVDEKARLQERKHLISEVSRGYYHDWNQLRHNGNKLWTAPPSLIQDQRALYFPNIAGIALSDKETKHTTELLSNQVSILAIESTRMSEEHTRSFYTEPLRMLGAESNLQLIRLNIQENPLKSWLVSLFINNLRRSVPQRQHARYLLSNQSLEYLREPLGLANKLLGYVYLIDWNKKIRWAGCGFSNSDEVSGLFSGTRTLLQRFDESKKS